MRILLILFIVMPIVEMWVLIQVGGVIGAIPTIGLVLLTACIGLALLRYQGGHALLNAQQKLRENQLPVRELADSFFFAIGGALLLTPGFVTDAIGFACLTPGIRTWVIKALSHYIFSSGRVSPRGFSTQQSAEHHENQVIEGEFQRDDELDGTKSKKL